PGAWQPRAGQGRAFATGARLNKPHHPRWPRRQTATEKLAAGADCLATRTARPDSESDTYGCRYLLVRRTCVDAKTFVGAPGRERDWADPVVGGSPRHRLGRNFSRPPCWQSPHRKGCWGWYDLGP